MISAEIVADSMAPCEQRLTTFVLVYPRFIHSELLTHRQFSRNSSSSRAIPVSKMMERIVQGPARPVYWGKNQKGMQADEELSADLIEQAERIWNESMHESIRQARRLVELGVHKQIANRILEPYAHMTTIVSSTSFENFFGLRVHRDAQPEFRILASRMLEAYLSSQPRYLSSGDWHLPFADRYAEGLELEQLRKISSARCARVSYLNFAGDIDFHDDYRLHDQLVISGHFSPLEHPARAESTPELSGNFCGFTQYRKFFSNEERRLDRLGLEQLLHGVFNS